VCNFVVKLLSNLFTLRLMTSRDSRAGMKSCTTGLRTRVLSELSTDRLLKTDVDC
jgi:hypothetical protein